MTVLRQVQSFIMI